MKIEFLIDKREYQKLLNNIILESQIKQSNEKVEGKDNYLYTLDIVGKNIASAKALSAARIAIEKLFVDNEVKYRLLIEEASQFFVQRLYPYVCDFETKLRKFIYISLFDLDDKADKLATKIYNSTMGIKKDKKLEHLPDTDFLPEKELHEIFDFLFANDDFLSQVNCLTTTNKSSQRHKTKNELLLEIKEISDTSIWEQLFKPFFNDSILPKRYNEIQKYRNDVMHFHNISYQYYLTIQQTFKQGIKDLDKQLNKRIVIEDSNKNVSTLAGSLSFLKQFATKLFIINSQIQKNLQPALLVHSKVQNLFSSNLLTILEQQKQIQEQLAKTFVPTFQLNDKIADLAKVLNSQTININTDEIKRISESLSSTTSHIKKDNKDDK